MRILYRFITSGKENNKKHIDYKIKEKVGDAV